VASPIRLLAVIEASTITGPAKNLLQFARLARSSDAHPRVLVEVAVFQRPEAPKLFLETARDCGVPTHVIPETRRFDRSVIDRVRALVSELKPDLVQSHAVKSHFILRKAGIPQLAPWIAFHHGYTAPEWRARVYNQLDWWSLRRAAHAITVSQPFRRDLIRKGLSPDQVSVVHNAVDPNWASDYREPAKAAAFRRQLGIAPEATVILLVGRFSSEKDHLTLLAAVSQLRKEKLPWVHLLLVGDGPERSRIEQAIRSLGLEGSVTLTGQVPSAEPYYGIADLAVLSSRTEGSPNALLEAMAASIPVVATCVGGIPEIVTDGQTALLVAPGDRIAMSRALAAIALDKVKAESLAGRARELIQAHYTPIARMQSLIAIYSRTLSRKSGRPQD